MNFPRIILLISGKRKSGKDFICEKIKNQFPDKITIVRISGPAKRLYASEHQLDFQELLSDSPYKEQYRLDMINWSDGVRDKTPGYFCQAACAEADMSPVWIVSDIRRKTDIEWFTQAYGDKLVTIRISADDEVRKERGWIFTEGVDDVTSECDLDNYNNWNYQLNNNSRKECEDLVSTLKSIVEKHL